MVAAWENSLHGLTGVGCEDCHGSDHSTIFSHKGGVSAATCGRCHAQRVSEFDRSLHAAAMDSMRADPKFARLSPAMAELGCIGCHQVGAYFPDGSRGKCNTCHSGHAYSVEEALRPEACGACHTGPDHPNMAMFRASKHGQLFASEATRDQAPTCASCHMPEGNHDTGIGLTLGHVASGAALETEAAPVEMRRLARSTARRQRLKMIETCLPCHSSRFATESLALADAVKREADAVLGQAVELINALHDEGLLVRADPELASSVGHALVLGVDQAYDGLSPMEQRFFDMFKFHHATTFKGAYHHSPDHTHNEGFLRMQQDLTFLRHEAARLRAAARDEAGRP